MKLFLFILFLYVCVLFCLHLRIRIGSPMPIVENLEKKTGEREKKSPENLSLGNMVAVPFWSFFQAHSAFLHWWGGLEGVSVSCC